MVGYTRKQLESKDKEELIDIILEMQDIILELQGMVTTLVNRVGSLESEVSRLRKPTTSRNSSLPPSKDMFSQRYPGRRSKSKLKTGGQKGHPGHTLEMSSAPDVVRRHMPLPHCPACDKTFSDTDFRVMEKRQVVDIPPIKSVITDHLVYGVDCGCGYRHKGAFPGTVKAPVQYGNNLASLVCYLSARQFVPMARLTELVGSITNISLSQGTVSNMLDRAARSFLPLYSGIRDAVSGATTIGGDETGLKVNGKKRWAWTWQTPGETFIAHSRTRGYDTVTENFPEGFPGAVYVCDSFGAQLKTPAKAHQLCLAHICRELTLFIEKDKSQWAGEMKKILSCSMELKKLMKESDYHRCVARDEILDRFDQLVSLPVTHETKKLHALQKRLMKYRHGIFTFLFHPDVPPDNNASERAIRNIKVKQKVSGEFRSDRGADIFAIIRSVVDTILKKGGDPMPTLAFALNVAARKNDFMAERG